MRKRLFAILLTMALVSSFICVTVFSAQATSASSIKFKPAQLTLTSSQGGLLQGAFVDEEGNEVNLRSDKERASDDVTYPESYDLRTYNRVTSIKDQGDGGICWAFGAINACESNAISKGIATNEIDFSEDHLVWFTNKRSAVTGDGIDTAALPLDSNFNPYHYGAYWLNSIATLASWTGAAYEASAPYSPYNLSANGGYPESKRYKSELHLQDAELIAMDANESVTRRNEIKKAIMENGALSANYYHNDECFNESTNAFYQTNSTMQNHAISIIGWSDTFSKSNFVGTALPATNGAWLCKNSWSATWGDNGYFWISYCEPSISHVVKYNVDAADNYDTVSQYDSFMACSLLIVDGKKSVESANVFTASDNQSLEAIGFFTMQEDVGYDVKIYTDPAADSPIGTLVETASVSGNVSYFGYHTVKLPAAVALNANQRYSVVVELTSNGDGDICAPFEGVDIKWSGSTLRGNYVKYNSQSGESYVYDWEKCCWCDTADTYFAGIKVNNATIKAYCSYSDSSIKAQGVSIDTSSVSMKYKGNFSASDKVTISPAAATNRRLLWGSTDYSVASVDQNGIVTATGKGSATIYAFTADGKAYDTVDVSVSYTFSQYLIIIFLFGWIWFI